VLFIKAWENIEKSRKTNNSNGPYPPQNLKP
jgi:hypothetical protein